MWYFFLIIFAVGTIIGGVYNVDVMAQEYQLTEQGPNYDKYTLIQNGTVYTKQVLLTYDRISHNGQYVDFIYDSNTITSAYSTVRLTDDGVYEWLKNGNVIFDDTIIAKYADISNLNDWTYPTGLNNMIPVNSWNGTSFISEKENSIGNIKYKYVFLRDSWKTQLEATNLSVATTKVFGFDQIVNLNKDSIFWGGTQRNLDKFDGTTFNRVWIENNESRIIDFLNGYNFDFDLGFDYLYSVTVHDTGINSTQLVFDYRYTDSPLLPGQTLIIDPTYSSGSPTEDGDIADDGNNNICESSGATYTKDSSRNTLRITSLSTAVGIDCYWSYIEWNTGTIPDGSIINDVDIDIIINTVNNPRNVDITAIANKPSTSSASTIMNDIGTGTEYIDNNSDFTTTGAKSFDLGATANSDVQSKLVDDFFAVGFKHDNVTLDADTHESTITASEIGSPTLTIVYTEALPTAPTGLTTTALNNTAVFLDWDDAPSYDNVTGYKIWSESPVGGGFSPVIRDTGSNVSNYTATGLVQKSWNNFKLAAWNSTGLGTNSSESAVRTHGEANGIFDLVGTATSFSTIELTWTIPDLFGGVLSGFMINYTTPQGDPDIVIINNTNSSAVSYEIFGLNETSVYSFRVGTWNEYGFNGTGNIVNATTTSEFVIGSINIPQTDNTGVVDITFTETSLNDTATQVVVQYPNTFNITCNIAKEFAITNQTYTNLDDDIVDTDYNSTTFVINGTITDDIIEFNCYDGNGANYTGGRYIITQSDFPFLQQIDNFRNGTYGTQGMFGVIDFITLAVVILSMLGFSRSNETVGLIFNVLLIGGLGYFGIITVPSIIFGAIAVILMFTITSTRKV